MVKKPEQPVLHPMRRNKSGAWLCNAVADCDNPATVQTTVPCSGCTDVQEQTQAAIDRKRAELDQQASQEQAVLDAARLSDAERIVLAAIAMQRQQIGADLRALTPALAAVVDEHTHPVFACDKHAGG